MKKTLILLLVLILSLFTVSAFEDFSVATAPSVSVCACTSQDIPVTVTNANALDQSKTFIIGDTTTESTTSSGVPSTYSVAYSGSGGVFATALPPAFGLSSGQSGDFITRIGAPCDAQGVYDLTTTVTTGQGLGKSFAQTVSIQQCSNLGVTQGVQGSKVCPCKPAVFSFSLQNAGSFVETYDLVVDSDLAEYISLSEAPVLLSPGQTKIINLYVNSPCEIFGVYDINVLIEARNSGQEYWKGFQVEFDQACYDYDISLGKAQARSANNSIPFEAFAGTYEMCELEEVLVPIKLLHTSNISNAYTLELDAEEWVSISADSVSLQKNQQTFFVLKMVPPEGVSTSETQFIYVETVWGELEKRGDIKIKAESCYLPDVAEDSVTVSSEGLLNVFTLQNQGTRDAVYAISIKGESWITPEDPTLTLAAGETTQLRIKTIPGEAAEGKYIATVVFTTENGVSYEREIEIVLKNVTFLDYIPYAIALLILLFGIYLARGDGKVSRKVAKKTPRKKTKLRWGRIIAIILILLIGAGAIAGVLFFKDKVIAKVGDNTLDATKPLILEPGVAPSGEDSDIVKKLKNFEPFPYFWYAMLGIGVVLLVIIINEVKRRKGKPKKEDEAPEQEVPETKEEPVEEKIEEKVVEKTVENEPSGGMKHWKLYLLIIAIIILGLVAYLLWPQISGALPVNMVDSVKGVFAKGNVTGTEAVKEVAKEPLLNNPLWASVFGVVLLIILIIILEIVRRRKQRFSPDDFKKEVPKEEPKVAKTVKKVAPKKAKPKKEGRDWKVIIWPVVFLIVLAAVIGGIKMFGTEGVELPTIIREETKEPTIITEVKTNPFAGVDCSKQFTTGKSEKIDLSRSFQDPDNDELTFSATKPEHFEVAITDGVATLTPDSGFTGVDHIVFNAVDSEDNEVSSGILTLCVQAGKFGVGEGLTINFEDISSTWLYVLIGVVIVAVIIVLHRNRKSIMKFLEEEDNSK